MSKITNTLSAWAWALVAAMGALAAAAPAGDAIRHGWTQYWAGLLEGGDVSSYDEALRWVGAGRAALDATEGDDATERAHRASLGELEDAIKAQRGVAEVTLRGTFPLTALLGQSLYVDSGAMGTYELVDDAGDVATEGLVDSLLLEVLGHWGSLSQTDVIPISTMPDRALEEKLLYFLSTSAKVNLRPMQEIEQSVDARTLASLRSGDARGVGEALREQFGSDRLIVVYLDEVDAVQSITLLELRAQVFDGAKAPRRVSLLGHARDRSGQQRALEFFLLACFGVGVGAAMWLVRHRLEPGESLLFSTIGFLGGVLLPNGLMTLGGGIEPNGAELAQLSFWWPIGAGALVIVGVPLLFTTLLRRVGTGSQVLRRVTEQMPAISLAVGAGAAGYLGRSPIVYDPSHGWIVALSGLAGAMGAARMVALVRARDVTDWRALGLGVFSIATFGLAFFAEWAPGAAAAGVTSFAAASLAGRRRELEANGLLPGGLDPEANDTLEDNELDQIVHLARHPPYQGFTPFERAQEALAGSNQRVRWVYLNGQRGSGKTSTARAIVQALEGKRSLLEGACSPPDAGEGEGVKPFEVFARALHHTGALALDEPEDDIFSSLEGTVIDAIPVVSMLLPSGEDNESSVSDRGELFTRVVRELTKQTRRGKRPVIVWLDDVQWMDDASQELLAHLMDVFPEDAAHPIAFVLGGRAQPQWEDEFPRHSEFMAAREICVELGQEERLDLLRVSLGFDERSAALLDDAVTDQEGKSNLAWLLTLVEAVARSGQIVFDERDGFFKVTVQSSDELPIPENFKRIIGDSYEALEVSERDLLRAAACLGYSFSVEVLARVLEHRRLDVIAALEGVGEQTALVEDDMAVDDMFRFVSTQRYVALREHLDIREVTPQAHQSQLLRDLHWQIAQVLEIQLSDHQSNVTDVARHYYAAGRRDLRAAARYCRAAARSARDVFAFEGSEFQLRRAQNTAELLLSMTHRESERAELAAELGEIERELEVLPYDSAHILGVADQRDWAADDAVARLATWREGNAPMPRPDLLVLMARACYDARRFDDAVRVAEALIELGDPDAPDDDLPHDHLIGHIEGLHFKGLSLSPGEAQERLLWLERARAEVANLDDESTAHRALEARVYNSLAEQLSQKATYDFAAAESWFERSVSLKRDLDPPDKPGLARSHGGLGRLHLFAARETEGDRRETLIISARGHFEEDVRLCREYGDVAGECQMHSHLGECALMGEEFGEAAAAYERSLALAHTGISKGFALAGLLRALDAEGDAEGLADAAARAATLALETSLPPFLAPILAGALELDGVDPDQGRVAEALEALRG